MHPDRGEGDAADDKREGVGLADVADDLGGVDDVIDRDEVEAGLELVPEDELGEGGEEQAGGEGEERGVGEGAGPPRAEGAGGQEGEQEGEGDEQPGDGGEVEHGAPGEGGGEGGVPIEFGCGEAEEDEADGGEQDEGLRGDEPEDAVAVFQPAGGGREAAP